MVGRSDSHRLGDITFAETRTAEALAEASAAFKSIVENSPFGIYAVDADFKLLLASEGAQKSVKSIRQFIGRDFAELVRFVWTQPFADQVITIFRHTLATGEPYHSPKTVEKRADKGDVESYDWKIERLMLQDGRLGVVCHFYDLSERLHYETLIQEREQTLNLGVSVAGFGIGKVDYVNVTITLDDVVAGVFDLPANVPLARSAVHSRFHPDDAAGVLDRVAASLEIIGPELLTFEHRVLVPSGDIRWVSVSKKITFELNDGERVWPLTGLFAMREITSDKEAQSHLEASDKLFRGTFENAAVGVAHVSTDGHWLNVNDKLCEILGYSREELTRLTFQAITYPEDLAEDEQNVRDMLSGKIKTYSMDTRYIRKDQSLVWTSLSVSLEYKENGEPNYFISVVRDITAQVNLTEALRVSRSHMNKAAVMAKLAYAVLDTKTNIITASESHEIVMGYATPGIVDGADAEYVIKVFLDHVVEADKRRVMELLPHEWDGESAIKIDYRVIGDDGKERWIQTQSIIEPAEADQFKKNLSISIDITEQKGAEERICQLMYEVNHRAKNLLTVVQAVARQTAKVGDPGTFLKRLSARIAGLAASQDLLVLTEWNGIQIADLVRAQLQGFSDQLGTRITVDGPKLKLKSHATQALGMAVHELATNASKYGALSNETGTVMITWKLSGDAQDLFSMTWQETGGPEVTAPTSQGFGQTVIVQLVQASLNGHAEINYLPTGLVWNVEAPVISILE